MNKISRAIVSSSSNIINGSAFFMMPLLLVCALGLTPFATCAVAAQEPIAQREASSEGGAIDKDGGIKGLFEGSKDGNAGPLYVKSDTLQLNAKKRVFTYEGNVEIVRGDLRITCDSMVGTYGEDSQLRTVLCSGNVVITQGEDMRASSNRAMYTVKTAIIDLTEAPELARGGNVLSADKITIFVDEDRSEADGNVRVKVIKAEEQSGASVGSALNGAGARNEERSSGSNDS